LCISTFAGLYRATLDRIEARGFDVFDGTPQLSTLTKLRIVGGGLRR
jgi:phytoene/squalene synthetase